MPLRIAFDLDGVFADMEGELSRRAERLFGMNVSDAPPLRAADATRERTAENSSCGGRAAADSPEADEPPLSRVRVTPRQQRRLWDDVESIENFWETLEEIEPGSVARLAAIAVERSWEVIFLTRRPATAGATAQVQSQRWLKSAGFPLPSVFVVPGSRGRIASALLLDFVVDDRPENCLDVVTDSKAKAILVWRDHRHRPPAVTRRLGVGVVRSVGECLDILAPLDSAHEQSNVMDRFRRLLGIRQAARG